MSDQFIPISIDRLARWIFGDLFCGKPVLGFARAGFFEPPKAAEKRAVLATSVMGQSLQTPLGVAAGPHTQLAQNIVAAYLHGARFIELKTVQTLDELEVSKPCIDAEEATFNCEWSQELKLEQSYREYLKAWVLLYALADALGWADETAGLGLMFNVSVGYDLAGIKKPNVQRFFEQVEDAKEALGELQQTVARYHGPAGKLTIPQRIADTVTLSTMHGCPTDEIEQIVKHLMLEVGKQGDRRWRGVTLKLNPTLLGPKTLREILRNHGHTDIDVPDAAFEHDIDFEQALPMLERLRAFAAKEGCAFGLKLTNTLEVRNHRVVFSEKEQMMYLSGRLLHPLTVNVALKLRQALGDIPMSLSGGADAFNLPQIVACKLTPVTVCTDLLKPGGYARLPQYLERLLQEDNDGSEDADDALVAYAADVRRDPRYGHKSVSAVAKGKRALAWFDCIAAPCQTACPTHQDVPQYLAAVAGGDAEAALKTILHKNPLPMVTGCVCDRACERHCVRNHYDQPLAIRAIKRFAAETASRAAPALQTRAPTPRDAEPRAKTIAIVGAGPGGLSAAYYLREAGCQVTLYDRQAQLGGTVTATIPRFRITLEQILADCNAIAALGVKVEHRTVGIEEIAGPLKEQFDAVVIAVGATRGRLMGIEGETLDNVMDGYRFLSRVQNATDDALELGQHVLIIGGGNAAMDAARTAWRLAGKQHVRVLYRRTRREMPADAEEIHALMQEGVAIDELVAPAAVLGDEHGKVRAVRCQKMRLSERDISGRPRPVPIEGSELELPCSTMIVCVSQEPEIGPLPAGLELTRWGTIASDKQGRTGLEGVYVIGDATTGPSNVIGAIAAGRQLAATIIGSEAFATTFGTVDARPLSPAQLSALRRTRVVQSPPAELSTAERQGFALIEQTYDAKAAASEAARCLRCDQICDLCVGVCPNRANVAYQTSALAAELPRYRWNEQNQRLEPNGAQRFSVAQTRQILNLADACNECGNCATFCPTKGAPYRDKPRLYLEQRAYLAERDALIETGDRKTNVLHIAPAKDTTTLSAFLFGREHRLEKNGGELRYMQGNIGRALDPAAPAWSARLGLDLSVSAIDCQTAPSTSSELSLETAAKLAVLLDGAADELAGLLADPRVIQSAV
jgi:putative selenate reductase